MAATVEQEMEAVVAAGSVARLEVEQPAENIAPVGKTGMAALSAPAMDWETVAVGRTETPPPDSTTVLEILPYPGRCVAVGHSAALPLASPRKAGRRVGIVHLANRSSELALTDVCRSQLVDLPD